MKILHIVINYDPSIGGIQLLYKGVSENCVKVYNDEVTVYTVNSYFGSHSKNFKKISKPQETINGVLIKRFPFLRVHLFFFNFIRKILIKFNKDPHFINQAIAGPVSYNLFKSLNKVDVDIISGAPSGFSYMTYPLYRHKLKNPKPFVYSGAFHFQDSDEKIHISNETLKAILKSEYCICYTQFEKQKLMQLGIPEEMIVVTGVAANVKMFENGNPNLYREKFKLKDDDILIGYVGRIATTKNIAILLDSFVTACKQNSNIFLVIAGAKSDYASELINHVSSFDKEVCEKIFWEFNMDDNKKVDLFHALDIFILPSINESFGIVFLEAWSCKKPVIGAAIGAIKSIIDDGKDGLLMEPNDVNSLKEKIILLSNNKVLRKNMGENGYKKTIENYTWERVTEKYRDTYIKAIKKFNNVQGRI